MDSFPQKLAKFLSITKASQRRIKTLLSQRALDWRVIQSGLT